MSDYSCHKHGYDFHEDCVACEAADDWASQERRIAELEQQLTELREASERAKHLLLQVIKDPVCGWSKGEVSMIYRELEAALPEEGK